jgi:hypothetical protein
VVDVFAGEIVAFLLEKLPKLSTLVLLGLLPVGL